VPKRISDASQRSTAIELLGSDTPVHGCDDADTDSLGVLETLGVCVGVGVGVPLVLAERVALLVGVGGDVPLASALGDGVSLAD
jgi:hypothetical protein